MGVFHCEGAARKHSYQRWMGLLTPSPTIQDVHVDHRRADVGMAEELLDRADVIRAFEQVCGERVAKCVTPDALGQARFPTRLGRGPLYRGLVQVKPRGGTKPVIPAEIRPAGNTNCHDQSVGARG
jgi:hypothetical protein